MKNKINLTFVCVLIVSVFILFVPAVALAEEEGPNILFILDSSGSMMNPIGNVESRMEAAKRVLSDLVAGLPAETNVGLEAYGHREKTGCDDIEIVVPVGKLDVDVIKQKINSLEALGNTPIASALERGADEIQGLKGKRTIVLISDGEETCKGNPINAAEQIRKRLGADVIIQVIGLAVDDNAKQQLAGIAQAGGGTYYSADNAEQLKDSLVRIKKEVVEKAPPKEKKVVAKKAKVIVDEEFNNDFLSDAWEVRNDDPNSRILDGGSLIILTSQGHSESEKVPNLFLYGKDIPEKNYVVSTKFKVAIPDYGDTQWVGIVLYKDKDNLLVAQLYGKSVYNQRFATFGKRQGGKWISWAETQVGAWNQDPHSYAMKIVKERFKYTALIKVEGEKKWRTIGRQTYLGKGFKPGIIAIHDGGRQVSAEFDWFKITTTE